LSGPIPARLPGAAKARLLGIIDQAVSAGWSVSRACSVLELDRGRAWRWRARQTAGELDDRTPGGNPVHGLLEWEEKEILALFDQWGEVDLSHRKLAHRGSYENRLWVSPSTVDRVLARHGLVLKGEPAPGRSKKTPWPDWCEWRPNQLWCWDGSQFEQCEAGKYAYGIVDLVSRKWITTILVPEATATQANLLSDEIRERLEAAEAAAKAGEDLDLDELVDDDTVPLLLAISDNGTEMKASETRKFMALCSIAQHFGRRSTPTDQAWIETLWGHIKREHPHLMAITDPAVLAAELERVRVHYNTVRLHEAIGYVTPEDEHDGRGDAIRQARRDGMELARARRITAHRHPDQDT
jgi:transposase InsO family protein